MPGKLCVLYSVIGSHSTWELTPSCAGWAGDNSTFMLGDNGSTRATSSCPPTNVKVSIFLKLTLLTYTR
eukprot:m.342369 g.342369  ORF g.342369 m.342369 type:complete len:69 (+) comp21305_c0_seq1:1079-1285(+)